MNRIALLSIAVGLPVSFSLFSECLDNAFMLLKKQGRKLTKRQSCFDFFIQNVGPHFETWKTGILGPVVLHGLSSGKRDLTWQKWSYQVS